ncbi:hypothetical protein D4764_0217090 [Takifugu flavidus]|uniref:Ig-like domain-containing protein n=1 Tax=Takifugu flavidus TaxID=433684 RepID=A0A5C6MES3_9TELE|nr:hypothetical protein D4764_0217090 [Takifugu flavidus]
MAAEDQTVTLDCNYTTATATDVYVFWYKQMGPAAPVHPEQGPFDLMRDSFTVEGHMTQEEVCSSVSNHAESRKSCQKRTRPPPNVEHQTVLLLLWSFLQRWNLGCGFFWLLFALSVEEKTVMQPPEDVVAAEGDTVTLDCTFQTTYTSPNLFWYKQDGTSRPQFILSKFTIGSNLITWSEALRSRPKFSSNESRDRVDLQVSSAAVPDSAVYDCAVRPRVTGNPHLSTTTQHPALEAFVTPEGHMTQEEVCSSVSNHAESRKSCQKRTRPPPNVEHQTVSPAALELLAEMEPWLWILLAAFALVECRGEDKVMQPPEDVVAAEGDTVTLDCTFQTTYPSPTLFWYKQDGTSRPQFILSRVKGDKGKTEDEFKERFSSTLNPTMNQLL